MENPDRFRGFEDSILCRISSPYLREIQEEGVATRTGSVRFSRRTIIEFGPKMDPIGAHLQTRQSVRIILFVSAIVNIRQCRRSSSFCWDVGGNLLSWQDVCDVTGLHVCDRVPVYLTVTWDSRSRPVKILVNSPHSLITAEDTTLIIFYLECD